MLLDPIGKIFAPFYTPDEVVLCVADTGLLLEGHKNVPSQRPNRLSEWHGAASSRSRKEHPSHG